MTAIIHISVGTVCIAAVTMAGLWMFRPEIKLLLAGVARGVLRYAHDGYFEIEGETDD